MAIATFGSKEFEVSKNKIYTFDNMSFSFALDTETQEVEGKKPATYIKGLGLIPLSFNLNLDARFVDVMSEIDWWKAKTFSGKPEIFTLGGKVLSTNKFLLKRGTVSNLTTGKNGIVLKATLALEFEEYDSAGKKSSSDSTTTKSSTAPHVMSPEAIKAIEEAMK